MDGRPAAALAVKAASRTGSGGRSDSVMKRMQDQTIDYIWSCDRAPSLSLIPLRSATFVGRVSGPKVLMACLGPSAGNSRDKFR
jgi:hypothetical protein